MLLRLFLPLTLALAVSAQDRAAAMGARLADAALRDRQPLPSDLAQQYVARLGRQLALHAEGPNYPYTFTVFEELPDSLRNPTHEPLALPGGEIFIPASLLLQAHDTAELAGMLAHAIAHVADFDCTAPQPRADQSDTGAIAASRASGCWIGPSVPLADRTLYRNREARADLQAVRILAQSGYDPSAFLEYLRRVQPAALPSGSPLPPIDERVATLQKEIANLLPGRRYTAGEDLSPLQIEVRKRIEKRLW